MLCSRCQQDNPPDARFCNACGAKLQTVCPQCTYVNPPDSRFCNECGVPLTRGEATKQRNGETEKTSISSASEPPILDPRPIGGERRQLTMMFIDLVGSTTLSQQLDPEDYHSRVRAYQAACRQAVTCYDG
jgi:ribosomal protein L40E